jgi:hypothetical protein
MNMKRHEAREYFERLVALRERYGRLGSDDLLSLVSIDEAIASAELLAADLDETEPAAPATEPSSQDDFANQTGY